MKASASSWTRREFLLTALAGLAGCRWPGGAVPSAPAASAALSIWLQGGTGDPAAAARIGRLYLARYPGEQDRDRLIAELEADLAQRPGVSEPDGISDARLLERLFARVRAEYAHAGVVDLEGWVLSRSEARLYALVALADPGSAMRN